MDSNSQQEDTDESKVDDGMNQNRNSTSLKIAKLDQSAFPRNLNQQARS